MAIDTEQQFSPGWWLKTLARELQDRRNGRTGSQVYSRSTMKPQRIRPGLDLLDDHFRGDPPLAGVAEGWKDHFRAVARMARLNVAELAVQAKSHRMQLRDFRTAAPGDEMGDAKARDIMRATKYGRVAHDVHDGFLSLADAYTMVTPTGVGEIPVITAEDAREVITAHDATTGRTLAALKLYRDTWDAADFAYVYIAGEKGQKGRLWVAKKAGGTSITASAWRMAQAWEWVREDEKLFSSRVPVVRFQAPRGVGIFENHLDTLDRINDQILNKLVIAKVQAYRQRAIKNLPDVDEDDNEIDYSDAFEAAPGSMWQLPEGAELWESTPTDLGPVRLAIKDDLEHFAAVTFTPLHIITPDAASGSAEGASLMREENVYAVEKLRDDYAGPEHALTMSLAFEAMGDTDRADVTQIEPIWGPAERYSLQEKSNATAQLWGKLPGERIWTDVLQYPPAEVPNLRALRGRDLIFQQPGQPANG